MNNNQRWTPDLPLFASRLVRLQPLPDFPHDGATDLLVIAVAAVVREAVIARHGDRLSGSFGKKAIQ